MLPFDIKDTDKNRDTRYAGDVRAFEMPGVFMHLKCLALFTFQSFKKKIVMTFK